MMVRESLSYDIRNLVIVGLKKQMIREKLIMYSMRTSGNLRFGNRMLKLSAYWMRKIH